VNDVFQGKFQQGSEDFTRVIFNSTFGIAGISTLLPTWITETNEDFGQTLARGASPAGLTGLRFRPSTFRDGFGLLVDGRADLVYRAFDDVPLRNSLYATVRSQSCHLLDASSVLDQAALDR